MRSSFPPFPFRPAAGAVVVVEATRLPVVITPDFSGCPFPFHHPADGNGNLFLEEVRGRAVLVVPACFHFSTPLSTALAIWRIVPASIEIVAPSEMPFRWAMMFFAASTAESFRGARFCFFMRGPRQRLPSRMKKQGIRCGPRTIRRQQARRSHSKAPAIAESTEGWLATKTRFSECVSSSLHFVQEGPWTP